MAGTDAVKKPLKLKSEEIGSKFSKIQETRMRYTIIGAAALIGLAATPVAARQAPRAKPATSASPVTVSAPAQTTAVLIIPAAITAAAYDPIDSAVLNTFNTEIFGAVLSGTSGSIFNDTFNFLLDGDAVTNAQVSSIDLSGVGVNFMSILLDGYEFTQSMTNPMSWSLDPGVLLAAGEHNIYVNGTIGTAGTGSYSGNINLTAPGAVPEPGTWAMMLLGFAGMGLAVRRRRRHSGGLMQVA